MVYAATKSLIGRLNRAGITYSLTAYIRHPGEKTLRRSSGLPRLAHLRRNNLVRTEIKVEGEDASITSRRGRKNPATADEVLEYLRKRVEIINKKKQVIASLHTDDHGHSGLEFLTFLTHKVTIQAKE